jgi:putative transposase
MPTLVKTVILPLNPETNRIKLQQLTQLTRRCTYAVELFLQKARLKNVSSKKALEQFRHEVQARTGLSSGIVQACRDRTSWLVKAWKNRTDEWQEKVSKKEEDLRKAVGNRNRRQEQLADLTPRALKTRAKKHQQVISAEEKVNQLTHHVVQLKQLSPAFPTIKRRQPIWFDNRIGFLGKTKTAGCHFHYWLTVSTLNKGKRLSLPMQVYPYAERFLNNPKWKRKSFSLIWNRQKKGYFVHLKLEKHVVSNKLTDAWGVVLGMKRLVYAVNDDEQQHLVIDGNHPSITPLLQRLKELNNRLARLQRLGRIAALKKQRYKRSRVAEHLRNVLVKTTFEQLATITNGPILIGFGYPKRLRDYRGVRQKHLTCSHRTSSKRHRKRLHRWSYKALLTKLLTKALEYGHLSFKVVEYWTTKRCHCCGKYNVTITDRSFLCHICGYKGDRDGNASCNIRDLTKLRLAIYLQKNNVTCDFPLSLHYRKVPGNEKVGGRPSPTILSVGM